MNSTSADVIVIGGGPSGVAAAIELRRRGVKHVMVLEREAGLGGATRHCSHSPFGMREFGRIYLGAAYGRRLERETQQHTVDVRTGYSVVGLGAGGRLDVTSSRGVETLTARRIMITTGAREKPRSARLMSGDRPVGVITTGTLQCYIANHRLMPFRRPLIVGSELVSMSAVLTCLAHGASPVAVIEPRSYPLARAPFRWLPAVARIPFHRDTQIVDIIGQSRVEAVVVRHGEHHETLECDGVLLTGQFTPEASLLLQSPLGIDAGSEGPAVDQYGRLVDPHCFAGGNVLRAVETGGWAFREGRAVATALAEDLGNEVAGSACTAVSFDAPIKLVVPHLIRRQAMTATAFEHFQLRFSRHVRGRLSLELDGREVWQHRGEWWPERRVLVPIPGTATQAEHIRFRLVEEP